MAATVWKGHLTMGLVSVPVRLVRAARPQRVPLRQLYRPAKSERPASVLIDSQPTPVSGSNPPASLEVVPVKQVYQPVNVPDSSDEPPQAAELVKGYESAKGQYVILDEQELRQITPKTSTEMEIVEFVRFSEVDPIYLETSYYVVPEGTGEKAYALLFEAMREEGHAAIAHVSMHRRDHVMIVRPGRTGLVAHTMFYADEVRNTEEFRTDTGLPNEKERQLAKTLIHAMLKPFDPDRFKNQYREQLQQLISSRAAEHQTAAVETPTRTRAPAIDIMDALKRSLAAAQTHRRPPLSEKAANKTRARKRTG